MKIDVINFGAFTGTTPAQHLAVDETGTSGDEFDDTRIAKTNVKPEQKISNPIEKQNGTIEELMSMQASTEKMAHSYGFSSVEQASNASAPSGAVSPVGSMSLNA